MAQKIEMVGGCSVTNVLIPKWTLRSEKCLAAGKCVCLGAVSKYLLRGDYDGYGKKA